MFITHVQNSPNSTLFKPVPVTSAIKKIALVCLKELAISLAMGAAIACFVPVPGSLAFMANVAFVQLAVNAFFHSMGAYASYKVAQKGGHSPVFERLLSICEWMTACNFAILTGYNAQLLIHEVGHASAAMAVYNRPRILIEIFPFDGGKTQFHKSSLTYLGKKLGPMGATCFILAGGPATTLLVSAGLFAIGLAMKEKYPHFGKYLVSWAMVDFFNHAQYAFSALYTAPSTFSHDFVHLAIFGLHPIAAAVGILAVPFFISLGISGWQAKKIGTVPMNGPV